MPDDELVGQHAVGDGPLHMDVLTQSYPLPPESWLGSTLSEDDTATAPTQAAMAAELGRFEAELEKLSRAINSTFGEKLAPIPAGTDDRTATALIEKDLTKLRQKLPHEASSEAQVGSAPDGSLEAAFMGAMAGGTFDLRGRLGQLWAKEKKNSAALGDAYAKVKGYAGQRNFRMKWASEQFERLRSERAKIESTSTTDQLDGEYCNFSMLVQRHGDNLKAGTNYALSCIEHHSEGKNANGRPYLLFNDMSKMVEFLNIKKIFKQTHEEKWELRKVDEKVRSAPSSTAPEEPDKPAAKTKAGGKRAASTPAAAKASKHVKVAEGELEPEKKVASLLKQAHGLKVQMQHATSSFHDLQSAIANQPEWSWARNDAIVADLKAAFRELENHKVKSAFWKDWVVQLDFMKHCKRTYLVEVALKELEELPAMQQRVEDVVLQVKLLRNMHNARAC